MNGDNGVGVLAKVAAILDGLAAEGELTPARLAELVDAPRSTVYRLLGSLQQAGFVEQGARRGTYRLGLKLLRLGSAVAAQFDERRAALPVMERLHRETGETIFLCARRGDSAVCIERLDGRRVQSLALLLGGSLPLHAGAAPRVLLAYESEEVWEGYLARGELQIYTRRTPAARDELLHELRAIRAQGYAVSDEDVTPGIAAIGAPVFDYSGAIRASLSVSGVRPEILGDAADTMIERVVRGAREVSRGLGFAARDS